MIPKYHFISGLPRSGSTLISAILRQNPRFLAGMSSPVLTLVNAVIPRMSPGQNEFSSFFSDKRRRDIIHSVFEGYYQPPDRREVIFDTNRGWCGKISMVADLFPNSHIICCVREIGWIIDSVERMIDKNPLQMAKIFSGNVALGNIYTRVESMMNIENGFVGKCYANLRSAYCSRHSAKLIIIGYEELTRDPEKTIKALYVKLDEPYFDHDFDNVNYDMPLFDEDLGMPGLHKVRPKVAFTKRRSLLPPDIFARYPPASMFWTYPPDYYDKPDDEQEVGQE